MISFVGRERMSASAAHSTTSPEEEAIIMNKLECLKELRTHNAQYEKLKSELKKEIEQAENEEKYLSEYKTELNLLHQEKMAHVEELRQIHSDINSMESVIKQSEEDRNRHLESAKQLYHEFMHAKEVMDRLRTDLGLPRLPDPQEDDGIKPEFFKKQNINEFLPSQAAAPGSSINNSLLVAAANAQQSYLAASSATRVVKPALPQPLPPAGAIRHPSGVPPAVERPTPSAFRQQPPPMKSCLSCHQQIHRNAPICPLCKAKSRSRNPKKPKRKMED